MIDIFFSNICFECITIILLSVMLHLSDFEKDYSKIYSASVNATILEVYTVRVILTEEEIESVMLVTTTSFLNF